MSSCDTSSSFFPDSVFGYRPVYAPLAELEDVRGFSPRAIKDPGRIVIWEETMFVNDLYEGIHIFDISTRANPINVGFIKILGCVEIDVRNGILFADNYTDLITIDITNLGTLEVTSRTKNVFVPASFPPATGVYFECADSFRGIVVGWEFVEIENPKCFRP